MKTLTVCFSFLFGLSLLAQEKGVSHISTVDSDITGTTYAVVVGISDYQDEGIPDLRFADKDAEAFAAFLQSPAGGGLDEDHLKVLINKEATAAQFAIALDWLWEVVKENDRVIVYFSGHGDVERKSLTQPGYLLCWDAPSRVYLAGGAIALPMFQDVISTLSVQNKAKVIVITDACRSGKLSGSAVGGAQLTSSYLARQYANEIKILSCQPEEYSIEGEQWGGGRGAFSYHLLDGLYGLADGNKDNSVDLKEIGRYLEDHVTEEVAPQDQNPMIIGSKTEKLTRVFPEIVDGLKEGRKGQLQYFAATESRGIEDEVLASADSNVVEMYISFHEALKEKRFLEPANFSADFYYEKLIREPQLEKLHTTLRRNYAAALQDDAQQVMNTMLKSGLTSGVLSEAKAADIYRNYPVYLDRAAELLGSGHYMYAVLKARKYYFKGIFLRKNPESKQHFFQALHWQSDMPHAYAALIDLYPVDQADSAGYYAAKAMQLSPTWVNPYLNLAWFYKKAKQYDKAEELLNQAFQLDSNSILVWYGMANYYKDQRNFVAAEKWYLKTIAGSGNDICFPCAYNNLGYVYLSTRRYDEAVSQFEKAIQLDSTFTLAYNNLGGAYRITNRYALAEKQYQKAIQLDSAYAAAYNNFGYFYALNGRFDQAEKQYLKAIHFDSNYWTPYANLGFLYQTLQRWEESEPVILKCIEIGPGTGEFIAVLGNTYTHLTGRQEEARKTLDKGLELSPHNPDVYIYLAQWSLKMNLPEQAWQYLEQGLEKGIGKFRLKLIDLQEVPDFEEMRKEERWKELMEKYFPEEAND